MTNYYYIILMKVERKKNATHEIPKLMKAIQRGLN